MSKTCCVPLGFIRIVTCVGLACALAGQGHAAPYVPASGEQVVERVPGLSDPAHRELRRMRAALTASPENLHLASELARRYIEMARSTGEPRYTGYAQAALSPWWNQSQPPTQVRVLRATILQSRHQFSQALADLDAVLAADRRNAQAWLTRATIQQTQGEHDKARESCSQLNGLAPELVVIACIAGADSLGGEAAQSYALLDAALKASVGLGPGIEGWVLTLLAEMAASQGDYPAAEKHFLRALSLSDSDIYLLGAYADFLLDQERAGEAATLLRDNTRADGLLLRYALALRRQGLPAAEQIDTLQSRFAAAALRGDSVHLREQARYELHLRNDPQAALELAQKNWREQKETADARILLEAAVAGNAGEAARPVLNWLNRTGTKDRVLRMLAAKLEGAA